MNDEFESEDEEEKAEGTVGTQGMKAHPFLFLHDNGSLCTYQSFISRRSRSRPVRALQTCPSVPGHRPARAGPGGEAILASCIDSPAGGSHLQKSLEFR